MNEAIREALPPLPKPAGVFNPSGWGQIPAYMVTQMHEYATAAAIKAATEMQERCAKVCEEQPANWLENANYARAIREMKP